MKIKIHIPFLILFFIIFGVEVCIALFVHDSFIRPFIGDVLVVLLIYSCICIFYSRRSIVTAIGVFLFACLVEIAQFFQIVRLLGLEQNTIAGILIGSTFDWMDILAYGIGFTILIPVILFTDYFSNKYPHIDKKPGQ
ncbi:MAG: DUF2809 domain-containing protein [Spirochaetales bacterium]|nr:DUF2809 domain-containing protein [Spirochaetales bacterium]